MSKLKQTIGVQESSSQGRGTLPEYSAVLRSACASGGRASRPRRWWRGSKEGGPPFLLFAKRKDSACWWESPWWLHSPTTPTQTADDVVQLGRIGVPTTCACGWPHRTHNLFLRKRISRGALAVLCSLRFLHIARLLALPCLYPPPDPCCSLVDRSWCVRILH